MDVSEKAFELLNEWNWDSSIVIGTALFVVAYLSVVGPFRSRFNTSEQASPKRMLWFLLGSGVIFVALVSPLDTIGDRYLFTAHMFQHMLLLMVAPPMLLLGTPGWVIKPFLRDPVVGRMIKTLSSPVVAFVLFNANLFIWHIPWLYEAALQNEAIHVVEHMTFIVTGIFNWMPLLSPVAEVPRLSSSGRIIYLILDMVPSMILGLLLVSASTVLYPTYALAPHVLALYGTNDQLIGGLMMEMPIGMLFIGALGE